METTSFFFLSFDLLPFYHLTCFFLNSLRKNGSTYSCFPLGNLQNQTLELRWKKKIFNEGQHFLPFA